MGGAVSAGEDNDDLVDNLLEAEYIKTPAVERVFRAVDRAHYFTPEFRDNAYKDLAWKSCNLHLSAPCIYSEVMESLALQPGMSFLNLGSGPGYLNTMAGLILGPYGINHGIELHEDVVNYAYEKLEEFKRTSPALDAYEFCEPKFIKGNCLKLGSEARQYDRVYCGAACPDYHENYMKNLIKVGGILVIPLNDQLLEITRTSQTTWSVKTVLPVSFAPLVLPDKSSPTDVLPDVEPLSLQELCRSTIRTILRRNVEAEYPGVKERLQRQPKHGYAKKSTLRRLVIPIFEESDNEDFAAIITENQVDNREYGRASLICDVHRQRVGEFSAVIELARNLAANHPGFGHVSESTVEDMSAPTSHESENEARTTNDNEETREGTATNGQEDDAAEEDHDEDDVVADGGEGGSNFNDMEDEDDDVADGGEMASNFNDIATVKEESGDGGSNDQSATVAEQRKKTPKRKKSDSGIGDETENGKCASSDSDREDERTFMEVDSDFSDDLPAIKRTYQADSSSQLHDRSGNGNQDNRSTNQFWLGLPQPGANFWKQLAYATDEESDEEESADTPEPEEAGATAAAAVDPISTTEPPATQVDTYSKHMRLKIKQLPLPLALKDYLNLNRDF